MPAPYFDRYITVDWNASKSPTRKPEDSIWVYVLDADGTPSKPKNLRTRGAAENEVRSALRDSVARRKRVLVSFDFAYGYPARFASALDLRGESWQAIWHYLLTEVQDDAVTNMNNRFRVADAINRQLGHPVFWGQDPYQPPLLNLPRRGDRYGDALQKLGLAKYRAVEQVICNTRGTDAKTVWQLWGRGVVGSQTLTGIPVLARLLHDEDLAPVSAVWPFQVQVPDLPPGRPAVIHAEMFPSLFDIHVLPDQSKDEAQVMYVADKFRDHDRLGTLGELFAAAASDPVSAEEGWILGVKPAV